MQQHQQVDNVLALVKLQAEIDKLRAETAKIVRETGVIPFVAGAGFMVAATGLAALILKGLGI